MAVSGTGAQLDKAGADANRFPGNHGTWPGAPGGTGIFNLTGNFAVDLLQMQQRSIA
jgi:hypothetical protein